MPKSQSLILCITTVSVALFLGAIPSPDSFAIGVPPLSPKPRMPLGSSGKNKPNNALMKKGTSADDHNGGGHFHVPHFPHHSKEQPGKCKDMFGNLVSCPTLKCKDIYGNQVSCPTLKCKDIYGNQVSCPTLHGAQSGPFR